MGMSFDPHRYGPDVAAILALDGSGDRLMPLALGRCLSEEVRRRLRAVRPKELFHRSPAPEAALSGLCLYFSFWEEAHAIAQDVGSKEGSFWHGIIHRQEPDASNASYWFHQVGWHPIFPKLHQQAIEAGIQAGPAWDPFQFIELCERARRNPGSDLERKALLVQRAEWQLLFDYCARPQDAARRPERDG
jgi:hypothetical protein